MGTARTRATNTERPWSRPDLDPSDLSYNFGSSVLDEFVAGHDMPAILRELIQNEYDAGGRTMVVRFDRDALRISGTGSPISEAGWKRLSVVMGTGAVHGTGEVVAEKVNGIGSKNFGLRSLFLLGDRIYVRSAGNFTVLDRLSGTLPKPRPDPAGEGAPGVRIEVPYRATKSGRLGPFDEAKEAAGMNNLARGLAPTLCKLARPGERRSLNHVSVISARSGRELHWKQSVKKLQCKQPGVTALQRMMRFWDTAGERKETREEREFQRVVQIPADFREERSPNYFVVPGRRIRIGVSVRMRRGKIDLDDDGIFYYPLGVPLGLTGTAVSINAPFAMDADRSNILPPEEGSWNRWLLESAVDLVFSLLATDWLDRFGAGAYLALRSRTGATLPYFAAAVRDRLKTEACFPTRKRGANGNSRALLALASRIAVPESDKLDGVLADTAYLDTRLSEVPAARDMVLACGAGRFSINSLVRLRCVGKEATGVKLSAGEASWFYTKFPAELKSPDTQVKLARAIDGVRRHLSNQNRATLRTSPTTLTAAGTLAAPESLYVVDPELSEACPIPRNRRLHPILLESRVIRSLCNPFDVSEWASEAADRIRSGKASDEERKALYRHLVSIDTRIPRTLAKILRDVPVLLDHRSEWTAPSSLVVAKGNIAEMLEPVLQFPHADFKTNIRLKKAFRFREMVSGEDLVEYARLVTAEPARAAHFERFLRVNTRLLTRAVAKELRSVEFLRSSKPDNALAAPEDLYVRTPQITACLGNRGPYPAGKESPHFYESLGCRTTPGPHDILDYLLELRERGENGPRNPDLVYPALASALRREGLSPRLYAPVPMLWTSGCWSSPQDTLVGDRKRRIFVGGVPIFSASSETLVKAVLELGATLKPETRHWTAMVRWFGEQFGVRNTLVPARLREPLRNAYAAFDRPMEEILDHLPVFLDRNGRLYSRADVRTGRFLIDDDPAMAAAVNACGLDISFADQRSIERSAWLFTREGVRSLTESRKFERYHSGGEWQPPVWVQPSTLLDKLHRASLASALAALVAHTYRKKDRRTHLPASVIRQRLAGLRSVVFARRLEAEYRIGRARVRVLVRAGKERDRILFSPIKSRSELLDLTARVVEDLLAPDLGEDRPSLTDAIYRLLESDSDDETRMYLENRGIRWKGSSNMDDVASGIESEQREALQSVQGLLANSLSNALNGERAANDQPSGATNGQTVANGSGPGKAGKLPPSPAPLPSIDKVTPEIVEYSGGWTPAERNRRGGKGGGGWNPPTPGEEARDREIGRRGEEIVLRIERERARAHGLSEERVVWTANLDPGADHDIRSVDSEGNEIWVEVKATTGRDGKFRWSRNELELAIREGSRYVLYRVYRTDSGQPMVKRFTNPVALLGLGEMRFEVANLFAEVEPA
jgi:hypothetical protein